MTATKERAPRRAILRIPIGPQERSLIDRAARSRGQKRTDFILSAARQAAEEALLDRALLAVTPEAYAEFLARLDAPPATNERLIKTMRTHSPWDAFTP